MAPVHIVKLLRHYKIMWGKVGKEDLKLRSGLTLLRQQGHIYKGGVRPKNQPHPTLQGLTQ
jgi:hypothetical protein